MQQIAPYKRSDWKMTRVEEAMRDMFNRVLSPWEASFESAWSPVVDIAERETEIVVKAELPGMKREEIDIAVQGNTLILSGEKCTDYEKAEENYYHVERRYGMFRRTITLPAHVLADKVNATYDNGVLTITLPKSEHERARHIPVK